MIVINVMYPAKEREHEEVQKKKWFCSATELSHTTLFFCWIACVVNYQNCITERKISSNLMKHKQSSRKTCIVCRRLYLGCYLIKFYQSINAFHLNTNVTLFLLFIVCHDKIISGRFVSLNEKHVFLCLSAFNEETNAFLDIRKFLRQLRHRAASVLCTLTHIDDKMSMGVKSSKRCVDIFELTESTEHR